MFRAALVVLALIATVSAQRSFINKCSLSAPDLEQCFIRNGNLAIKEINLGIEDLQIPSLDGFDLGDMFFSLENDLSFLLEDGKVYPVDLRLENARLKFSENKQLSGLELHFVVPKVHWEVKYRALGFVDNRKIKEKGFAQINFGEFKGNYTIDFKYNEIDGVGYLKVRNQEGKVEYEKFEFVPRDVQAVGEPLAAEQFQQLELSVIDRAVDISIEYITFAFDQILQEIPAKEIFLP